MNNSYHVITMNDAINVAITQHHYLIAGAVFGVVVTVAFAGVAMFRNLLLSAAAVGAIYLLVAHGVDGSILFSQQFVKKALEVPDFLAAAGAAAGTIILGMLLRART
jgi:hypothetical protein